MKLPGGPSGGPGEPHPGVLLSAHLDEELDPATNRAVLAHLRNCEGCRAELESVRGAREAIRGLAKMGSRVAPQDTASRVAFDPAPGRRPWWGPAVAAAVLGGVLLGEPRITSPGPQQATSPSPRPGGASVPVFEPVRFGPATSRREGAEERFWGRVSRSRPAPAVPAPVEPEGPLSSLVRRLLQTLW